MSYETILLDIKRGAATVTLNRPEVRNAFDVRVIVLAAGSPAFCAGADLNVMKKMALYSQEENLADAQAMAEMLHQIFACPKPVVAKIHGDCYAGGMGLVAACDISVATDTVQFCLSEVKLGLIPATISPYVIRAMGANAARRYFVTAERFSAKEAHRIGFIHEVVAAEELDATVARIVRAIADASPNAVLEAKWLVQDVTGMEIDENLLAYTAERIAAIRTSDEGREGISSFLEKRKPEWLLPEE